MLRQPDSYQSTDKRLTLVFAEYLHDFARLKIPDENLAVFRSSSNVLPGDVQGRWYAVSARRFVGHLSGNA